ncbi:MAG: insulinase family protein [Candidatus Didemnitutus sp.]|nr:insulinase family protein [Candidatus Didemnitutus sp.]
MNIAPRRSVFIFLFVAWLGALTHVSGRELFPHEQSDLQLDPALTFGRLPNGLRYLVRSNSEPASRVFLILRVHAGSLHEGDDESGFAHFVEHMAFNGTKKFPGASLVETMQRSGYSLGAHVSAFTGYNSTFYQLDVPRNDAKSLAQAFGVLREWAEHVTFDPKRLKKELGIVESERLAHTTTAKDLSREMEQFLYGGTRIATRPVIGTPASLRVATVDSLRAFYRRWYRPSRMTVIAVGDLPVEQLTALIAEHFGTMVEPNEPMPPEPPPGALQLPDQPIARFLSTPHAGGMTVALHSVLPNRSPIDDAISRRSTIALAAGYAMLNERLQRVSRSNPMEYGQSQAAWFDFLQFADIGLLRMDTRHGMWRRGVVTLEQELRRALTHGFTETEVAEQKVRFENSFTEAIRSMQKISSVALAQSYHQAIENGFVSTSPRETWDVVREAVATLTPQACHDALRAAWPGQARQLIIFGTDDAGVDESEITAIYQSSGRMPLAEEESVATETFAYEFAAEPGEIKHRAYHAAVDLHTVEFANGVRLSVKRTDYELNRIYTRVRVGYGRADEPPTQVGISVAAATTLMAGGIGKHDENALNRLLAGESLGLNFQTEEDTYSFWGWTGQASFARLLQLNAAIISDPAFREPPMFSAMVQLRSHYDAVVNNPEQFTAAFLPRVVYNNDRRYGLPNADDVFRHSAAEIREWMEPILAKGPLDISIAGDVDVEKSIDGVARTFGTLPARPERKDIAARLRPTAVKRKVEEVISLQNRISKASVAVAWPFRVTRPIEDPRRVRMLSNIIHNRVLKKVREELGATYSPATDLWQSTEWPTDGYLHTAMVVEPAMARKVASIIHATADDLAKRGITQDEFDQVYQPRIATLDQELRNNAYWLYYVLPYVASQPWSMQLPLGRTADYQSITREELNAFARRYLIPGHAATVTAIAP